MTTPSWCALITADELGAYQRLSLWVSLTGRVHLYFIHMNLTNFANQLQDEFGKNSDALMAEFPERLETENGYEPMLDWAGFISTRIEQTFPALDEDAQEEMLEDVRNLIVV